MKKLLLFTLVLVLALAACQPEAALPPLLTMPPVVDSTTQVPLQVNAPVLKTPTLPPTYTPQPSETPLPPTPTASETPPPPTEIPGSHPTPSPKQREVFEELWKYVNDEYLYPNFNGVDWQAVGNEFRLRVESGLTQDQFYQAMKEMIHRLEDEHSSFLTPQELADEQARFFGKSHYYGVGLYTPLVGADKRSLVVALVFPNSPAEEVGIKAHDSILEIDNQPAVDELGLRVDLLQGPENSQVTVKLKSPGGAPRQVTMTRRSIDNEFPVPYASFTSPNGKHIGYILIPTFMQEDINTRVYKSLQAINKDGLLDGLIIDMRFNSGGSAWPMVTTLSYFTNGTVGYFVNRKEEQPLEIEAINYKGTQTMPLVVLVGRETISFGEVFSGILKDIGRAHLIGEITDGNVEVLWPLLLKDGSVAWIAHDSFRPLKNKFQNWELSGIIPDETVPMAWEQAALEADPAVLASFAYFDRIK